MPHPEFFTVLAHQGGWDEILLVVGPIAVILGLLAIVKRRLDSASRGGRDPLDRGPEAD